MIMLFSLNLKKNKKSSKKKFIVYLFLFLLMFATTRLYEFYLQKQGTAYSSSNSYNSSISSSVISKVSLGTNLNHIADWSTEFPFLDAFKTSRKWITQCASGEPRCNGSWDTHEFDKLDLDEHGWVKSLPLPEDAPEYTRVGTLMFRGVAPYPEGKYLVLYEGEGTIEYRFDAKKDELASKPGRDVINVTPSEEGIYLIITSTDPDKRGNYIRNIHVVPSQYETTYQSQIFNPEFLEKISKFQALRFMNWINTNNSDQDEWSKRSKIDDASYTYGKGVPIEIMVELANRLEIDPWFNIPHKATDEYIGNFAQIVKDKLNPKLKAYVEFSNEVWNPQFEQQQYALEQGKARWGQDKEDAYMHWYGMRTAQMCDIWQNVFGEKKHRAACVVSTNTAWKGLENAALECSYWVKEGNKPCYQHDIDVYAVSGYFGGSLGSPDNSSKVESWLNEPDGGFNKAFKELAHSLTETYQDFIYHGNVAKQKGLQLVVYEGGQHIVGRQGVENNEKLTNFFIEINRRPEMYDLYTQLLNNWQQARGALFMNYRNIGRPSKWGSFGALEHVEQDSSPKYDALIDFIEQTS